MSCEIKDYTMDILRDTYTYTNKIWRSGLSSFPPAIVTCAITGANGGKETNPNLPETIPEQVESTYEAYKAGAVMVHIHCRNPQNTAEFSMDPELYLELNAKIREKCPDIIINNTAICGRNIVPEQGIVTPTKDSLLDTYAEVSSVDISNYFSHIKLPARPGVPGREQDIVMERGYCISQGDALEACKKLVAHGTKPEFECFQLSDLHYLLWLINNGYTDPFQAPHWLQFVFTTGSNWPTPEFFSTLVKHVPNHAMLGVIATGAMQFPILTQALIAGAHVRVGMEDNVYIGKGRKADSNAQLVEKICRIADELGRPRATCEQARAMLGLGAPRQYKKS